MGECILNIMNEWRTGHSFHGVRVLIKVESGNVKIAMWVGSTGVCDYNAWQTDESYWYPETSVMGWMPLPE